MTTFQKIIKYIALVFAVSLTLFIVTTIFDVMLGVFEGISGDRKRVSDTYEYDNITSLDAELSYGKMVIRSEGSQFIVNATDVPGLEIEQENGELKIETSGGIFFFGNNDCRLEIIVPEGTVLDDFDVETGAGECSISDISAKNFYVDTGAGECSISDVVAKNAEFDTGAGELSCKNLDAEYCKVDAGVGEVNMSFTGNSEDYSISIAKGLGDISVNGDDYSKSKHMNGNADRTVDIDMGVGEVEIEFLED